MDLLVVRHGIAMDRDEALERAIGDRDRPLTRKGRSRLKKIARGVVKTAPGVRSLLTSHLLRAHETAEILSEAYGDIEYRSTPALLPEAEPDELARVLSENYDGQFVGAVGHEPHLSRFVSWCLAGDRAPILELKKGGVCLLRFQEGPGESRGRLIWLAPPAILRHI